MVIVVNSESNQKWYTHRGYWGILSVGFTDKIIRINKSLVKKPPIWNLITWNYLPASRTPNSKI